MHTRKEHKSWHLHSCCLRKHDCAWVPTILQPQDDLRRPVEARDKIGCDLIVPGQHGAAKIADLHNPLRSIREDVVGLDVGMKHAARAHMRQRTQKLIGKDAHHLDVQPDVATILLDQLPQIERLYSRKVLTTGMHKDW